MPGISFRAFPVVLRRRNTDSSVSRAQAGDRNEDVGETGACLPGLKWAADTPAGCCHAGTWPSMARASVTFRESANLYFYVKY